MAALLEFALFTLPFLIYLAWWRLAGRKPGHEPSRRILTLAAIGIACGVAGAVYYGLSRSFERGEKYVPARIEGGVITRGEGVSR
jgi:drug/metabolite transporter (DMT)-like permease